jgi:hypothetical protein
MMKKTTILFYFLICSALSWSQSDSSFLFLKKIKGEITKFTVDQLDNIYLLSPTDQLKKIDANGDSVAVFNNIRRYGKASYIDVSNPMRVLLYYKDFTIVVILDRLLNIRTTIDLRQENILQVQAVGLSYDNKIWLYDEWEHKLKKIDEDGKLLFETSDFRQLFNEAFSFTSIFDKDGYLYLYDEQKGVFVFDYYGSLKRKIPFTGMKNFKATGKYLFGIKNDTLFRFQTNILLSKEMKLPLSLREAISINFNSNFVYALKNDGLEIYLLK